MSILNFLKSSQIQDDPERLFKRQLSFRFLLFIGMIVITTLALLFLSRSLASTVQSVKTLRGEHRWLVKNNDIIASLFTEQERAKELRAELSALLPKAIDVPGKVIAQFQREAGTKQLSVSITVDRAGEQLYEGSPIVTLSITGSGAFKNILSFLQFLEQGAPRVRIASFSIAPIDGTFHTLQATAFVYVQSY